MAQHLMAHRLAIFLITWLVAGFGTLAYYRFGRNVALKRRVHPWLVQGAAVLLLLSAAGTELLNDGLLYMLFGGIFIALILMKFGVDFCERCGSSVFDLWSRGADACSRCAGRHGTDRPPEH